MKGKFIVIEGGDGAGKDTQIDLLKQKLGEEKFLFVKDPGSTDVGMKLRELLLFNNSVTKRTELLLYLAARVQLMEERIQPALLKGTHVISNRFDLSTFAYQIYGRDRKEHLTFVQELSEYALSGTKPDLVIYLDCPPEEGLKRLMEEGERMDKFEKEKIEFHKRVHEGYRKHLPEYNHVIIDATKSIGEVYKEVETAIHTLHRGAQID